jgi:amidase
VYVHREGDRPPLAGVPFVVTDTHPVEGLPFTQGSVLFADQIASHTHPAAQRLLDAGAILVGKTTCPEFGCAGFTHSRLTGTTQNPWWDGASPGGSCGGSAVAVASGMAVVSDGSDTGGSVRIPAAACGLVGYKPPWGRNPGLTPLNLDALRQNGPITRSVADVSLMQAVTSGQHRSDMASLRDVVDYSDIHGGIDGWRIAYSPDLGTFPIDPEVRRYTEQALGVLVDLGAKVTEVSIAWPEDIHGVWFNHFSAMVAWAYDTTVHPRRRELTDYVRAILDHGRTLDAATIFEGLRVRNEMYAELARVFDSAEVLVTPTLASPTVPSSLSFPADPLVVDGTEVNPFLGWALTFPFNLVSACAAISVPSGIAASGAPVGLQIVGKPYDDLAVLRAAMVYEAAVGPFPMPRTEASP